MFFLFSGIISIVLSVADNMVGTVNESGQGLLVSVYGVAVLIPSIAVTVRRLHDTGRSGWYLLIGLVPCVGGIVLLVFMAGESDPRKNEYGPNPKRIRE